MNLEAVPPDLGETVHAMSGEAAPDGYPARPRFAGHEELLLDFITRRPHRRVERRSQHHTASGPLVVDVDDDDAPRSTDGPLRHVDGAWRIAERRIRPIGSPEAADILGLDA
jgi:hypothetical protein